MRPRSAAKQRELQRKDSYGHDKLAGEEALRKVLTTYHGPTHMSLRLPDVMGARDNTGRFFQYLLWLRLAADGEVAPTIPADKRDLRLSFTWSRDVGRAVVAMARKSLDLGSPDRIRAAGLGGEAFNVAFAERPTLGELFRVWSSAMGLGALQGVTFGENGGTMYVCGLDVLPIGICMRE